MMLSEIKQPTYKIFVDMDGVLADFEKGTEHIIGEKLVQKRYLTDPKYRAAMWKAVNKYTKEGGEFWFDLDPLPDALQLWNYVKDHDSEILTATGDRHDLVRKQKIKWISKYLGSGIKVTTTKSGADKYKYAKENYILIDDQPKSIDPWIAAGGIGILHTSTAKTIKELKKLGL